MVQDTLKDPPPITAADAELVEHQLAIILASPYFKSAKQMQNFLQYIVCKTLAGKANSLKQYTIAVEALDFPADFDSDINPVVRIKAGRVRERLAKYYKDEGKNDALVITIPKGSYAPAFEKKHRTQVPSTIKEGHSRSPKLAVMCFSDETQDKESNRLLFQITDTLAKELSHFLFSRIIVSIPHGDKTHARFAAPEIKERYQAEYMLIFYIQQLPKQKHNLVCRLLDIETEEVLWSESYVVKSGQPFSEQEAIIGNITAIVADLQQGILHHHWARRLLEDESSIPEEYKALAYYRYYADDLGRDAFSKAVGVCESKLKTNPNDVIANVILADYCRRDYVYGYDVIDSPLKRGEESAQNAVRLKPNSHEAHFALGQILFCLNERSRCLSEFNLARDISQFHAVVEYGTGFHFCLMGQWQEGLALVEKAMSLTSSYPSWFNLTPFLNCYLEKRYEDALEYALKIDTPKTFHGPLARCVSYAQLGQNKKAKRELEEELLCHCRYPNFMDRGQEILTRFFGSEEISDEIWKGIVKANNA